MSELPQEQRDAALQVLAAIFNVSVTYIHSHYLTYLHHRDTAAVLVFAVYTHAAVKRSACGIDRVCYVSNELTKAARLNVSVAVATLCTRQWQSTTRTQARLVCSAHGYHALSSGIRQAGSI
jgi:hypothetical protein